MGDNKRNIRIGDIMYEKTSGWQNEREYEGIKHNTTNKVTQNKMSDKRQ